jgi:hypothetical protein
MRSPRASHARAWPGQIAARKHVPSLVRMGLGVLALLLLVLVTFRASAERRGMRSLPSDQRAALYSRLVNDLRDFCGATRADPLKEHCVELASVVAQLDECQGECIALTRRQLESVPTR